MIFIKKKNRQFSRKKSGRSESKETEGVFAKTEERFRILIENASDAIAILDNRGKILYESPSVKKVLGYEPKQLMGVNFSDLIHPDDAKRIAFVFASVMKRSGKIVDCQLRIRHKDGSWREVEGTARNLLYNPKIKGIVVNYHDITEHKKMERILREEKEKYRHIFENVNDEIVYVDRLGKVIDVNHRLEDIFGYKPKEVIGKNLFRLRFFDIRSLSQITKFFKKILKTGKEMPFMELEVKHKDGHKFFIETSTKIVRKNGKAEGFMVVIRDITERKKREEEIKRGKAQDEALLAGIGEGVIAVNNEGKVIFVNQIALDMVGYSVKELTDKFLNEKVVIVDEMGNILPKEQRPISLTLLSGQTTIGGITQSYYYRRKDGTRFPVATIVTPVMLEKKIIGAIDIFRDITKEKDVDRMKTEFVSLASHQLKTPLTATKWLVEMMLAGEVGKLTDKQKEYLDMVFQSTNEMVGLVNGLLDVSRLEAGRIKIEPKLIQINDIIQNVILKLEVLLAEKKCKLTFIKKDPKPPLIPLDESLMGEVIHNLLTNAIRYSKPGEGIVSIKTEKKGNDCFIEVEDNGIGIPQSQQIRIFERFYRADNARKMEVGGTGLGLYLVKLVIDSSGGKVWFKSEEGKGTNFYVSIPLSGMKEKKGEKSLSGDDLS